MDLNKLSEPLTVDQIDFRIQSINKGGYATILAYKDARVDMQRLDDVCGPLNWKREHSRDNHNCTVSVWNESTTQWVGKEDTGTESSAEAQKGLASDSFKRACFNWGIGRELYDYPLISVKLTPKEFKVEGDRAKATWELKLKVWVWYSEFEEGKLSFIAANDGNNVRFKWGLMRSNSATDIQNFKTTNSHRFDKGETDEIISQTLECLDRGDKLGLMEIMRPYTDEEVKMKVWGLFNSGQRTAMSRLLS